MDTWQQDLENGMSTGNEDDDNNIFISLVNGYRFDSYNGVIVEDAQLCDKNKKLDTLILQTVYIPKEQRNQGIFKNILDFVEQKAINNGQHLFVGPFMTDDSQWIIKVCRSRGYQGWMSFGLIKKIS